MALFELRIEIPPAAVEAADQALLESAAANWSVVEDVIARRAWLVGLDADEATLRQHWRDLEAGLAAAGVIPLAPIEARALGDADWRDSYKAHFHAWKFGRLHWVPVWQRDTFALPAGDTVLWLDPGLAFGTGNHETTRLCIERLVTLDAERAARGWTHASARVIDAGCGSGILALSAVRLGFREVVGFDNDPEAVRVSEENAALNALTGKVRFLAGDLASGLAGRQAEVVMANILADVLIRFARELVAAVAPGGALVLSGILASENAHVCAAFTPLTPGWAMSARTLGEWSDVLLQRPR